MTDILRRLLLSIVTVMALSACSDGDGGDAPTVNPDDSDKLTFGFYIGMSSGRDLDNGTSRATPDGDYDRGEGYENFINVEGGDYRIYFFDKDNKYVASFTNASIEPWEWGTRPFSKYYLAKVDVTSNPTLRAQLEKGPTKIVMLANWGISNYQDSTTTTLKLGETTIADVVEQATIAYNEAWGAPLDKDHLIPLFGVMQFDKVTLAPNMVNLAGDGNLNLLRALAKIEVYDNAESLYRIKTVTLTRHNTAAFCAPAGVTHQNDYVKGDYVGDYTGTPTIPATSETDVELTLPVRTTDGHFIVYVPEYSNINRGEGMTAQLKVWYDASIFPDPYIIDFKYYQVPAGMDASLLDKPFNIMRNLWYKFELNKKGEGPIDVIVDIQPFASVVLNPDYGLNRDENGFVIYYHDSANNRNYLLDPDLNQCFFINEQGDRVYPDRVFDKEINKYIYWKETRNIDNVDQIYCYWFDRSHQRYYFRCPNQEMFYVNDIFNGIEYFYDPWVGKFYTVGLDGNRNHVDEIRNQENGRLFFIYRNGISYFFDKEKNEYYIRTAYGEVVWVSRLVDGTHYYYDFSQNKFFKIVDGVNVYVDEVWSLDHSTLYYRYYAPHGKSYILDRGRGEYFYYNSKVDRIFVTMTVDDIRYYFSRTKNKFCKDEAGNEPVDQIFDTTTHRILYSHVRGISYFYDSIRDKYYYLDSNDDFVYVENLPSN